MAKKPMVTTYQPDVTQPAIEDMADAVDAYRQSYEGELSRLTDDDILEVLAKHPGSGVKVEEARDAALLAAEQAADEPGGPVDVSVQGRDVLADAEIGKLIPDSMSLLLEQAQDKREEYEGSIMHTVLAIDAAPALAKALDGSGIVPKTTWDPDKKAYAGKGKEPDHYKMGKDKRSHFANYFLATPQGARMNEARLIITRISGEQSKPDDQKYWVALPNETSWENLKDPRKRKSAKKRWDNRFNNAVERFRIAQLFRLKRADLQKDNTNSHQIKVWFVDNDVKVSSRRKDPIMIEVRTEGDTPFMSDPKSFGTFNRYDIGKAREIAKANGEQLKFSHLEQTVTRGTETVAGDGVPTNPSFDQFKSMVVAFANYFDPKADDYMRHVASVVEYYNAKENRDELKLLDIVVNGQLREKVLPSLQKAVDQMHADRISASDKPDLTDALKRSLAKDKAA